jgi:hypothetical protein
MAAEVLNIGASSNIAAASYDPDYVSLTTGEKGLLSVTFVKGGTYLYEGVTPQDASAFAQAPSPGSHLHSTIKPSFKARKA